MCGSVYKCEHNTTHQMFAVKTIRRDVLQMAAKSAKRHSIDTEIDILKSLDHPNVIKLYEVYDDERAIYLVMELCTGGELYDYVSSAQYTERQACNIFHSIVKAINYCHQRGIAHRDLKLENFLFESKEKNAHIKLIDFGLSAKYANVDASGAPRPGPTGIARMTSLVGTSYYVAPEMISKKGCVRAAWVRASTVRVPVCMYATHHCLPTQHRTILVVRNFVRKADAYPYFLPCTVPWCVRRYTMACDVWALGVMMYMILSGEPPFNGANEREILKSAQSGKFQFDE